MNEDKYVQYGCGTSAPNGWLNFDASPTLRFERLPLIGKVYTRNRTRFPNNVMYGDIVKGLPIENESCKGIYCSHVLEHLSLQDFRVALRNTNEILVRGGIFRLVVPDLKYFIDEYVNNNSFDAAHIFLKSTALGRLTRARSFKDRFFEWFGNSHHLWMWDYRSIEAELKSAGFSQVRRAFFGDSNIRMFDIVENENRWVNCLGLECFK